MHHKVEPMHHAHGLAKRHHSQKVHKHGLSGAKGGGMMKMGKLSVETPTTHMHNKKGK